MKNERGSVFFIIMIGIALFAALSYAVTQAIRSNNSSGGDIAGSEKYALTVSDLQQYLESIKMQVFKLTSQDGIPETALDFKNDIYELASNAPITDNINGSCSTDTCHIFIPYNTIGISARAFPEAAKSTEQTTLTLPKNGHGQIHQIIIDGVGSPAPELVFVIHGINPNICNLYNQKQGITTNYSDTTTLTSIGESPSSSIPDTFTGSFSTSNDFGAGATDFSGKKSFCAPAYTDTESNRLAIWHVVKIR